MTDQPAAVDPRPDPQQLLNLPLGPNDAHVDTLRDYLIALLRLVWRDEECFDGKRPFGNSGWQYDLYEPLIRAGYVTGTLDEHGRVQWWEVDCRTANELIEEAIRALGQV